MNLSNDYMLVLDEIRSSKKISIADLCQDIITERTYYRMLKANQVKTTVFSQLINKLGVDLSEFIHYAVFVRKNDSRFKFIYRVHTKFYRDIAEHYQAMLQYQDPDLELDLLIRVYLKKYEYEIQSISQMEYFSYLGTLVPVIKANTTFNIYLFTIQLILQEAIPNQLDITLKQSADQLFHEEFSYSVILVAICYDMLLQMLMKSGNDPDSVVQLMGRYEVFMSYFPSRYFLMRYDLYKAYLCKLQVDTSTMTTYLFKFLMNALSMVEETENIKQTQFVSAVFNLDVNDFIYKMTLHQIQGDWT